MGTSNKRSRWSGKLLIADLLLLLIFHYTMNRMAEIYADQLEVRLFIQAIVVLVAIVAMRFRPVYHTHTQPTA